MKLHDVILTAMVWVPGSLFIIGGYILQRNRYWARVWRRLGKPQVESVKELRSLMKKQRQTAKRRVPQDETGPPRLIY